MPLRELAQELYRLTRKAEELEKQLKALGFGPSPQRAQLEGELLQTRKDRDHLRAVLESKKEKPLI
ncbi:MAG: hypothetical protein FJ128_00960 [Deltaproteobacteria bacterium]|nr:hypothetical protein [Deltaproteobacteria bacterium]